MGGRRVAKGPVQGLRLELGVLLPLEVLLLLLGRGVSMVAAVVAEIAVEVGGPFPGADCGEMRRL